ncbi:EVE domain-containing protein [Calothrix rhizosoleniae]|uniref:EVE domain-containing protein n=1 Tax=Calothrix rhizosoleniae TaxID=888997 RepID=UPI000B499BF6|nr:EVE domain-containing protein [Calothrix rhizosoleniae]
MAYWLLKTEPGDYSYTNLEQEGTTVWDGVNNALALKHMRTMEPGDTVFIYHTGKERKIIGTAEIVSQPYADQALDDPKRAVVKVRVGQRIPNPVSLAQIKQDQFFANFDLVRLSRLSVVPVSPSYWQRLCELGNLANTTSR